MLKEIQNAHHQLMLAADVQSIIGQFQQGPATIEKDDDAGTVQVYFRNRGLFRGLAKDANTWVVTYDSTVITATVNA